MQRCSLVFWVQFLHLLFEAIPLSCLKGKLTPAKTYSQCHSVAQKCKTVFKSQNRKKEMQLCLSCRIGIRLMINTAYFFILIYLIYLKVCFDQSLHFHPSLLYLHFSRSQLNRTLHRLLTAALANLKTWMPGYVKWNYQNDQALIIDNSLPYTLLVFLCSCQKILHILSQLQTTKTTYWRLIYHLSWIWMSS